MIDPFLNQCNRCSAWRRSKRVDLTSTQRCHLCRPCLEGRGPAVEAHSTKKSTKAERAARRDWVDLELAELHDARIHAVPMKGGNRNILDAALEVLGIAGDVTVWSLREASFGQRIGFENPVQGVA